MKKNAEDDSHILFFVETQYFASSWTIYWSETQNIASLQLVLRYCERCAKMINPRPYINHHVTRYRISQFNIRFGSNWFTVFGYHTAVICRNIDGCCCVCRDLNVKQNIAAIQFPMRAYLS